MAQVLILGPSKQLKRNLLIFKVFPETKGFLPSFFFPENKAKAKS